MTNAPYLLKKHRGGARIGHDTAYDHMFLDGLEDAYEEGRAMGSFAQCTSDEYQLTRKDMDDFAIASLDRAKAAIASGAFATEIAPVTIKGRKGDTIVDTDEAPGRGMPDKIPTLRPAFAKDGTITAATCSSISDGAAAIVLSRQSTADDKGYTPVARIVASAAHAQKPSEFTIAPIGAIEKLLKKAGWSVADVDLFEVNEAFACVAMFAMKDLGIAARQDQHPRRRHRARPPDRRQRHAHPRHPRQRAQDQGPQARRRVAVHRRRRSDGGGGRTGLAAHVADSTIRPRGLCICVPLNRENVMHKLLMLAAVAALAGCSQDRAADPAVENDVAAADANLAVDNTGRRQHRRAGRARLAQRDDVGIHRSQDEEADAGIDRRRGQVYRRVGQGAHRSRHRGR